MTSNQNTRCLTLMKLYHVCSTITSDKLTYFQPPKGAQETTHMAYSVSYIIEHVTSGTLP